MITPRETRLIRVPDLQVFRHAVRALSMHGQTDAGTMSRLVVVPTGGAAHQLRRALGRESPASPIPEIVTRDEFYDRLHVRLPNYPLRLTPFERAAIVQAAARESLAAGMTPPFQLRPGLIVEILGLYDQLRRQRQPVARFEELLVEALEGGAPDRGAERMLAQTRFLAATYRAYERQLASSGRLDEHALREHLMAVALPDPVRHVVVTVGDWIADPDGLFPADFDLLTRLPGLAAIDVVATEESLAAGLHQRLHEWLPGLAELDAREMDPPSRGEGSTPSLYVTSDAVASVSRDREEELVAIARRLKAGAVDGDQLARTAVVYARPLPYLYLAREVFASAALPYQTTDALPLAAEPFAAAIDVLLEFVSSQFSRQAAVELLRSPHFNLDGVHSRSAVTALNRVLGESRYLGGLEQLRLAAAEPGASLASSRLSAQRALAMPALNAAIEAAAALEPMLQPAAASLQLGCLVAFMTKRAPVPEDGDPLAARDARSRSIVVSMLDGLASAYRAHGDPVLKVEEVAADVRKWIEETTAGPLIEDAGRGGVQLLDAQAARYGEFDAATLVGLIETEWPERPRRNIFYPPGLLAALGWPSEKDRRAGSVAAFLDLLRSPYREISLSTFSLDDEALMEPSILLDEVGRTRLPGVEADPLPVARVFDDEALSLEPPVVDMLEPAAREWASIRLARTMDADARYHGQAGSRPVRELSVSAIETSLSCPFKYFARHVLRLEADSDEGDVMDPRQQGQFVHDIFQRFFQEWERLGYRNITADNLETARATFASVIEEPLARLAAAEAALERTRLLGSSVAPGLAEIVFRMEAEREVPVEKRLLEWRLDGAFTFTGPNGSRRVDLRGIADRIDQLGDGTFRLIDYKLSSAPNKSRALQLPIYGLCAEQRLGSREGRPWVLGEAAYIAFKGAKRIVPLFTARADRDEVLASAQARLIEAVERIERGDFPPTPEDPFLCELCDYGAVCRKDYVGDV